jgi:hypothetical protein
MPHVRDMIADAIRKPCGLIDTVKDGQLMAEELRQALRKPWLAQSLSRLIIEHDSEWGLQMARWNELDEKMPPSDKPDWEPEKQCIACLRW